MSKKEFNKIIDEKNEIIKNYYDDKIEEINKMSCADFIINFLNKEKKDKIKNLKITSLSSNFVLDEASTNISKKIDDVAEKDEVAEEVKEIINKIFEKGKQGRVKKYIQYDMNIKNYFPYEQEKLRKEDNIEKINEIQFDKREIYNVLNELSNLNEQIKEYEKENMEKLASIGIKMRDDDIIEENNEKKTKMIWKLNK